MNIELHQGLLESARERLRDAAATFDSGRTWGTLTTLTEAGETFAQYVRVVQVASEALSDGALHAAESAAHIDLEVSESDRLLALKLNGKGHAAVAREGAG